MTEITIGKLVLIDFEQESLVGNIIVWSGGTKVLNLLHKKALTFHENHECLINTKEGNQETIGIHLHWKWDFQLYQHKGSSWCRAQSSVKSSLDIIINILSSYNCGEKRGDSWAHYQNNCENTQICLTSRTLSDTIIHSGWYWLLLTPCKHSYSPWSEQTSNENYRKIIYYMIQ